MNDERGTLVDRLGAALERDPHERDAFLREACGGDEALRRDVKSLIEHASSGAGVVSTPAVALADGIRSALDEALLTLATLHPRKVEVVELRYFGGLTLGETAAALGISADTVQRDWRFAKAWLEREIGEPRPR